MAGTWWDSPPTTIDACLAAMGAVDDDPAPGPAVMVSPERPDPDLGAGAIELEFGGSIRVEGGAGLPPDLPFGYHRFTPDGAAGGRPLIASPGRCWLPDGWR